MTLDEMKSPTTNSLCWIVKCSLKHITDRNWRQDDEGIDASEMGNEFWMLTTNVQVRGVERKCQEHSSVCQNDVAICLQSYWNPQLCMLRDGHAVN